MIQIKELPRCVFRIELSARLDHAHAAEQIGDHLHVPGPASHHDFTSCQRDSCSRLNSITNSIFPRQFCGSWSVSHNDLRWFPKQANLCILYVVRTLTSRAYASNYREALGMRIATLLVGLTRGEIALNADADKHFRGIWMNVWQ